MGACKKWLLVGGRETEDISERKRIWDSCFDVAIDQQARCEMVEMAARVLEESVGSSIDGSSQRHPTA